MHRGNSNGSTRTIVLIGDMVASRSIDQRGDVQNKLRDLLDDLNTRTPMPLSPYTLTLGDEFQAVFDCADRLFPDTITLLAALYPIKIRFSFSVGELTTAINTRQAIGMDGPAFHQARTRISAIKKSGSLFTVSGIPQQWESLVQHSLDLASFAVNQWKIQRLQIAKRLVDEELYIKDTSVYGKKVIHQMAEGLRVSDRAIYMSIEEGGLREILRLFGDITELLNRELEQTHDC